MALYIPAGTRRRRTIIAATAALVIGLVAGLAIGRMTATTADQQIRSIQREALQTAAGLRVISLHDESGISASTGGGGTALVLSRTKDELTDELDRAAWITTDRRDQLLTDLNALSARKDQSSAAFGKAADAFAAEIEAAFGTSGS
jgi:hypothetical protein